MSKNAFDPEDRGSATDARDRPRRKDALSPKASDKAQRLSAALRANLARRKAQGKARDKAVPDAVSRDPATQSKPRA